MESDCDELGFDGASNRLETDDDSGARDEENWDVCNRDPEISFKRRPAEDVATTSVNVESPASYQQTTPAINAAEEVDCSMLSSVEQSEEELSVPHTQVPKRLDCPAPSDRRSALRYWSSRAERTAPMRSASAQDISAQSVRSSAPLRKPSAQWDVGISEPNVRPSAPLRTAAASNARKPATSSGKIVRNSLFVADGQESLPLSRDTDPHFSETKQSKQSKNIWSGSASRKVFAENDYACESDLEDYTVRIKHVSFESESSCEEFKDEQFHRKKSFPRSRTEGREENNAEVETSSRNRHQQSFGFRNNVAGSRRELEFDSVAPFREIQNSSRVYSGHGRKLKHPFRENLGHCRRSSGHDNDRTKSQHNNVSISVPSILKEDSSESDEDQPLSYNRRCMPNVKLGTFTGDSCLETFLAKFENISTYLHWKKCDRLFHLRASLEGAAGQILWDAGPQTSADEIIRLLRSRFGNSNQAERFRAELKARRRKKNESLQSLYNDICKLLALAFPGPSNITTALVGRDAFLDALSDQNLRIRVLEREPKTLEEALNIASRLEAYDRTALPTTDEFEEEKYRNGKTRHVRSVTKSGSAYNDESKLEQLTKQLSDLCHAIRSNVPAAIKTCSPLPCSPASAPATYSSASWFNAPAPEVHVSAPVPNLSAPWFNVPAPELYASAPTMFAPASQPGSAVTDSNVQTSIPHTSREWSNAPTARSSSTAVNQDPTTSSRVNNNNGRRSGASRNSNDCCHQCGERGHWRRNCPQKQTESVEQSAQQARLGIISAHVRPAEIYASVRIAGKQAVCLLDTGCERSIIGRKLIPDCQLTDTNMNLYAANGTPIPLIGAVQLDFTMDGHSASANLVVSDAIEDLILGIDWLATNNCQWDFGTATLFLNGKEIQLYKRPTRAVVRRIYVAEDHLIHAGHQADVPVKLTWNTVKTPSTDWVLEPKSLRQGVVAARTLLSGSATQSVIRIINYSNSNHSMHAGQCIGTAEPAEIVQRLENTVDEFGSVEETKVKSIDDNGTQHCPPHLQCILDAFPVELTDDQRHKAEEFVIDNASLFSASEYDIGRTHLVQHRIDTGENRPFKEALRRHPIAYLPVIDQHVNDMLHNDIIEPSASPWSSNVVLIKKRDGDLRFCIDYRRLNNLTYKDSYPLPRIDACLHSLGGSKYFSTLDLRSGFWQTSIDPRDRDKTAFVTRRGTFRFKVLSFGLANAPSLFQRLMDLVLVGLTWETCLVFLDDIIVFSETFEQHLERLSAVFVRLQQAQLKLKPSKCHIFQLRVSFLGHVVSESGIEPDPEKVEAVKTWPRPKNLTEVRAFVGLAGYYRNHIRGFAEIARPLHELTRKGERFQWNEMRELSFIRLKECLTSSPVLAAPHSEGQFVLDTDASDFALGAILQQNQDGVVRVIAYGSRSLNNAERSYCTTRKELLAIVFGLKKYRQFLLARKFIIRTDHAALRYLLTTPEPLGQQARWLDLLAEFDYEIQHRSGTAHRNSDALSRRPCEINESHPCEQCNRSRKSTFILNRLTDQLQRRSNKLSTPSTSNAELFRWSATQVFPSVTVADTSAPSHRSATHAVLSAPVSDTSAPQRNLLITQPVWSATQAVLSASVADTSAPQQGSTTHVPCASVADMSAAQRGWPTSQSSRPTILSVATTSEQIQPIYRSEPEIYSSASCTETSVTPSYASAQQRSKESDSYLYMAVRNKADAQTDRSEPNNAQVSDSSQLTVQNNDCDPFSAQHLRQAQLDDINVSLILQWKMASSERPSWEAVAGKSDEIRAYWAQWDSLTVEDGILYRRFHNSEGATRFMQTIMPSSLRTEFIRLAHGGMTGGHFGIRRTQYQVLRRAYWVGWRRCVETFCRQCSTCNQVHRGKPPKQGRLKPFESNGPMDRLHIDLCGPFTRSDGYSWILTCVDAYTRYLIAVPLRDKTAVSVAKALVSNVFCRIGLCRQIISDLGSEFQNELFKHLCQLLHVQQLRTTSYRPNCNGKVERVHRSLNSLMAKVVSDSQRDWSRYLGMCVMAYNVSRQESTSYSPFFLMHGREAICPLDLLIDTPQEDAPADVNEFAEALTERLRSAFRVVEEHMKTQVQRMKRNYDANVRSKSFKTNDFVWYYYPRRYKGRSPKWSRFYVGPYKIITVLNDVNYVLKATPRSKAVIAHIDKLRAYYGAVPSSWRNVSAANNNKNGCVIGASETAQSVENAVNQSVSTDHRKSEQRRRGNRFNDAELLVSKPAGEEQNFFRPQRLRRPPQRYAW
jgi:transposase InsO family protein